MADFTLADNQNVDVAITLTDAAGNTVTGAVLDAGSVTATLADSTEFTVTVSADQSSVNVKAIGPLVTGDVLTVNGSFNGVALTAGTLAFDVQAGPPTTIGLVAGTPAVN